MTTEAITSEIQKLAPSAVIELFVLDLTVIGGSDIYYFHAGTNGLNQNVTWQGQEYVRYPIEATGFQYTGQGQVPRPKLRASNVLGTITSLVLQHQDLIGAKVTRKRTFKKYLDEVNFSGSVNPDADDQAEFADDIYYVDRKALETRDAVDFELTSSFDVQGQKIPKRQVIQNLCPWVYRSSECSYAGDDYFNSSDQPVSHLADDVCGKRLSSCKKRFGTNGQLPFGGFPGAGLFR